MSDQSQPAAEVKVWEPPEGDQEFEFKDIASAPAWVDKGWASYDQGPALALPAGDLFGTGPYTTKTARVGDKVMFVAATASKTAHFEVVAGEPKPEDSTKKVPQVSAASLEDALKTGVMTPDDLGPDAKAQVVSRSPALQKLVEEGKGAPEPIAVADIMKVG